MIDAQFLSMEYLLYDKQIENVEHFKYLGAMLMNSGNSKIEIRIRLATEMSSLVKLKKPLLDIIMRKKMTKFGHITLHDSMSKTILQGYVEDNRKRGRTMKNWLNDIFEYSNLPLQQLLVIAKDRFKWKRLLKTLSCSPPMMPASRD